MFEFLDKKEKVEQAKDEKASYKPSELVVKILEVIKKDLDAHINDNGINFHFDGDICIIQSPYVAYLGERPAGIITWLTYDENKWIFDEYRKYQGSQVRVEKDLQRQRFMDKLNKKPC